MKRKIVTIEEAKKSGGSKYRDMIQKGLEEYEQMPEEKKHQIQVYYGYGKGKTTALLGLAIRALGAGKKVAIVQFDKGFDGVHEHYGERHVIRRLKEIGYNIDMFITGCERMNEDGTFRFKNADVDFEEANKALSITHELIVNGTQDLLLLDEILAASAYHLIEEKDVLDVIDLYNKNRRFEMVMSGHKLFDGLEEKVGLITEMRKVKHYFDEGIQAREGIEF
jgi:cob(I)alamin adenosyltransferase